MSDPDFALRYWRKVEASNPLVPQRRTGQVLWDPEENTGDHPDDADKTAPRAGCRRNDRTDCLSRGPAKSRL